jgi:hypothetical protein
MSFFHCHLFHILLLYHVSFLVCVPSYSGKKCTDLVQMVSCWPVLPDAWVQSQQVDVGFLPDTAVMGWVFLPILHFSSVTITIYQVIKLHFPLSTSQRHTGGVEVRLLSSLTLAPRDVSVQMNTLAALPPGKNLVPIECEGGWGPRTFLNGLEKSLFPLPGLEPWTSSQ